MEPLSPIVPTAAPWTSPGTTADAPRYRSAPTIFDEPAPASKALAASPVSRLQPRTVGQLLDGGFEVLQFRFRTIAIVAATIVLPLFAAPQALTAYLAQHSGASAFEESNPFLSSNASFSGGGFWTAVGFGYLSRFGLMLATMLMGVAVTHLVSAWLVGHDPTPADTLRFVRSRLPTTLGAFALALLVKVAGAIPCGLGLIYVLPALSVLAPVVAAERLGAVESVSRSFRLTRRRFGPVLGVAILWLLAESVVSSAAGVAAAVVGGLASGSTTGVEIAVQAVSVVATVVLTVVQVSVTALVYVDLRVRTEGLDLELESVERFGAAAA